jgi:type IV pilus assembly protein PilA
MKKGFTLLELLATIAIMAVLVAAVLPFVSNYTSWAKKTQAQRSALLIADAINRYNGLSELSETPVVALSAGNYVASLLGTSNGITIDGQVSKFLAKAPTGATVDFATRTVTVQTGVTGDATRTAAF